MQFTKHGEPNDNVIEKIRPLEKAEEFILRRLNCILEHLLVHYPQDYYPYIDRLNERWEGFIGKKKRVMPLLSEKVIEKYKNIRLHERLIGLQVLFFIKKLGIKIDDFYKNEPIEIPLSNFTKSAVVPEYYWVETLAKILGKEVALQVFRGGIERYIVKYDTPTISRFESLEEMREAFLKFTDSGRLGRIRISSDIEDGVWIFRCDNCEKVDALGDTSKLDQDILYGAHCYGDFQVTRLFNENFVMTRTQTIAKGDPYCDWVYHDLRYDKKLEHPSKEFMDSIWPVE
ncbi:MAG: L-2-amino-thiazoline-4-carboxylic acid hydrolase [Candidatus Thorarchaeota archaeon]